MTVTSKHRSCQLVPKNGISKSAGHLKIPNLYSKFRDQICFKYSRFKEKDLNIRIIFELKNCRIRIFEIRRKRFESESNPNIFDHLWDKSPQQLQTDEVYHFWVWVWIRRLFPNIRQECSRWGCGMLDAKMWVLWLRLPAFCNFFHEYQTTAS